MNEFEISWITGLMFGIEFPPVKELDSDLSFALAIDLGVLRFVFLRWREATE